MSWSALTAAQQDTLLRRPFDHFARYRLAAEVVAATAGPTARVLDLGGGPGSLQAFLPEARVVSTDVALPGQWHEQAPDLVLADGAALPFGDGAFDVVVTLDTLEHVVPASRPAFLEEVARVAGSWALVVCPFGTPGVADADTALRAYVAHRFGLEFPTTRILDEHLGYGHPDLAASTAALSAHGDVDVLPSGRLDRWFAGMVAFFHLLAIGDDEPVEVTQRFLNRTLYEADLAEPSYRHAILLRRHPGAGPTPQQVLSPLRDRAATSTAADADLGLLRVVLAETLVDRAREATQEAIAARAGAEGLQSRVAAAEARVAEVEAERDVLLAHLSTVEERHRAARAGDAARLAVLESEREELLAFRDRLRAHPVMRARRLGQRVLARARRAGVRRAG